MKNIEGFVLTGGASSRMGTPKASLELGGSTLGNRAAEALSSFCDRVYAVGDVSVDGVKTLSEARSDVAKKASILGLHSALAHCSQTFAAVLACDMPFVTGAVFEKHADNIPVLGNGDADVIVPVDQNGRMQPLCAIYLRDRCLELAHKHINGGNFQIREFLKRASVLRLEFDEFTGLPNSEHIFFNVNTRDDLQKALQIVETS